MWNIARPHNVLLVIVDLFQALSRRSAENDLSQLQDPTGNANGGIVFVLYLDRTAYV